MNEKTMLNVKLNKWFVTILFISLFAYIWVRAFTVEPMLDELTTFFTYIETGHIMDHLAWLDANNHLLNSYLGWVLHSAFGTHFILFRLLAVLSFPVYFFSIKWLVERLVKSKLNWIVFLAVISIPWIIEYFGFSRGYGPSLAFLFAGICFIFRFKTSNNAIFFVFSLILFGLSISSNLSLIIPCLICIAYAIAYHIIQWKLIKKKWLSIIGVILFIKFMGIILGHIEKLKSVNAFWWGSRDGLWTVTGKSLSRNVFFNESELFKYVLVVCSISIVYLWFLNQYKKSAKEIIVSDFFWFPGVLIAIVLSLVFMANFSDVNYPMDRVAMYLVPLFLLVFSMLVSRNNYLKWTLILLLWFPISFLLQLNLTSSVFSPEDRFSRQFKEQLDNRFQDNDVLSVDFCSHLSYAYFTRNKKEKVHIAVESINDPTVEQGEYHISWINDYQWNDFDLIYQEPNTKTRLYKRRKAFNKMLILDTIIPFIQTTKVNLSLFNLDLSKTLKGNFILSQIESEVSLNEGTIQINIINQIKNGDENPRFFQRTRFEWYFGNEKKYQFNFPNYPVKTEESDAIYSIAVENVEKRNVVLRNTRIRFYLVSQ